MKPEMYEYHPYLTSEIYVDEDTVPISSEKPEPLVSEDIFE